jgi:hypothetical protein
MLSGFEFTTPQQLTLAFFVVTLSKAVGQKQHELNREPLSVIGRQSSLIISHHSSGASHRSSLVGSHLRQSLVTGQVVSPRTPVMGPKRCMLISHQSLVIRTKNIANESLVFANARRYHRRPGRSDIF